MTCPATREAVLEREEEGDGCPLCDLGAADHASEEPVDELAIDAARDYCETCGKFTDGETCPACGDES